MLRLKKSRDANASYKTRTRVQLDIVEQVHYRHYGYGLCSRRRRARTDHYTSMFLNSVRTGVQVSPETSARHQSHQIA